MAGNFPFLFAVIAVCYFSWLNSGYKRAQLTTDVCQMLRPVFRSPIRPNLNLSVEMAPMTPLWLCCQQVCLLLQLADAGCAGTQMVKSCCLIWGITFLQSLLRETSWGNPACLEHTADGLLLDAALLKNTEQLSMLWMRATCESSGTGNILFYGVFWMQKACSFIVFLILFHVWRAKGYLHCNKTVLFL